MRQRARQTFLLVLLLVFVVALMAAPRSMGQTKQVPSLITERIDETQLTVLRGNTHPLARPEFDRGIVSPSMPIQHRFLVLRRSPEQTAALQKLLNEQQDPASPNYQKWLTPVEFGQQFGPSDQDVQNIVQWMQSHGLQVERPTIGRSVIEFSGAAAQVQQAFHTEIHNYEVNGTMHWANSHDPSIPSALTPVVVGVKALHDFGPRPMSHPARPIALSNFAREEKRAKPSFTIPSGCADTQASPCSFALGPADVGTIYDISSLWSGVINGSGQTIAVMGQAAVLQSDLTAFRVMFGVQPTSNVATPVAVSGDSPPVVGADLGDEGESDLDLEWAGAIAPQATILFVSTSNVDDSAVYTIENNLAPILSESYGSCEAALGQAGNQFYGGAASGFPTTGIWTQAAAQGITVLLPTGDNGSSACDPVNPNIAVNEPTKFGLQVSGLASTPYNTAVGGTDFNDATNATTYWNTSDTSSTTHLSAKGYIPETTWNDSCANIIWGTAGGYSTNPEANCVSFSSSSTLDFYVYPIGAGGGMSSCINGDGTDVTSCTQGYPKPSWQVAPGVPNDGNRDVPDISLFSGDGLMASFYITCQQDGPRNINGNSVDGRPCTATDLESLSGFGGTSASVQVFAGIMALVNQHMATVKNNPNYRIGLANPVLYELAQQQWAAATSCNSSAPANSCVFNDVTVGTIAQPCSYSFYSGGPTPNCTVSNTSDTIGILPCCDASTGYDLATGLGSVNVANLVNGWNGATGSSAADFWLSLGSGNGTVVIPAAGDSGSFTFTVTAVNNFTGTFTYTCSGLPTLATCSFTPSATDTTHTSVTVTVSTASTGMMVPASRPMGNGWWRPVGAMSLACVLCAAFLLLGLQWKSRRFATAAALLVFAVVLMGFGGCGPGAGTGGGGGSGGGTPAGFYTPVVSVASGGVTHTLNFNLSVR